MNNSTNPCYEQIQPLKAKLIEHFKKNNVSLINDATYIAFYHFRAINHKNAAIFKKAILAQAYKLKLPLNLNSINNFASEVVQIALRYEIINNMKNISDSELRKNVRSTVARLIDEGCSEETIVNRTAFILHKKRKKLFNSYVNQESLDKHPLKNILSLSSNEVLSKEDVRYKLFHLKNSQNKKDSNNKFYQVLAKASSFCAANIHNLLGDELFSFCTPLGFVDKNETVILIQVINSTVLYKLTYRKLEIINLLKKDAIFSNVKNIKFVLKTDF